MAQQAGDKTEKASPKRQREAREKGQVFKSMDLTTAFTLIVVFGTLSIFGSRLASGTQSIMTSFLGQKAPEISVGNLKPVFGSVLLQTASLMLPILAAAMISGVLINFLQVGFLFSAKAAAPKLSHLNFFEGLKKMFSKRSLVELVKTFIKLAVLVWVGYGEYTNTLKQMPNMMATSLYSSISTTMQLLLSVAFKLILALLIMAPFDYLYQWWRHRKDLMMTKQEVREEYKMMEGDPKIKGRIRERQRQMSMGRMMHAVKNADVIITNPTHYAVALEYKQGIHDAPVIIAKGKDLIAQRIKEKARENNIAIVENKPVARHLYFFCEIGDTVPQEMFQAVAEILAYVFRLKQNLGRAIG